MSKQYFKLFIIVAALAIEELPVREREGGGEEAEGDDEAAARQQRTSNRSSSSNSQMSASLFRKWFEINSHFRQCSKTIVETTERVLRFVLRRAR